MTELEKVLYTKSFIDKLANGVNPLNDEPIPEGELLNNVRISRCMFYVSGILDGVCKRIDTKPKKKNRNADKAPFLLTDEQIQNFDYAENGTYISYIIEQLNSFIDIESMQRIKRRSVVEWLIAEGYLYIFDEQNGKIFKRPTQKGVELGLIEERRTRANGEAYWVVMYNKNAQEFIVENANYIANI